MTDFTKMPAMEANTKPWDAAEQVRLMFERIAEWIAEDAKLMVRAEVK